MNFSKKDYFIIFLYVLLVAIQFYVIDLLHFSADTLLVVHLAVILLNAFIVLYGYRDVLSTNWKDFKNHKWTKWLIIIAAFALIACFISLVRKFVNNPVAEAAALEAVAQTPEETNDIKNLSLFTFIITLIMIFVPILSSVTEEVMFRHVFMYKHSKSKFLQYVLLILSSVAFGVIHFQARGSIEATIPYVFVGFILGVLYLWKKNIWYNIFTHMLFNGINVLLALLGILYQRFLE